ncbi:hypothetical protein GGF46_001660 [Coemansia sp. RSA 552]|nr:hypothetical protein GGF46_001660 [Coemansia sp. RSA 552]
MKEKQNLNWEISVLAAQTGKGQSLWKARAMEAKRQRAEAKRAKKQAGGKAQSEAGDKPQAKVAPSGGSESAEARLERLRRQKFNQMLHSRRGRFRALLRKLAIFEKNLLTRRRKKALAREDEAVVKASEEALEQLGPVDAADLVECMVYRVSKRSYLIRDALALPPMPEKLREINEGKGSKRILDSKQAASFINELVVGLEGALLGVKHRGKKKVAIEAAKAELAAAAAAAATAAAEEPQPAEADAKDYESCSDLDAEPRSESKEGEQPASKFVGSLAEYASASEDEDEDEDKDEVEDEDEDEDEDKDEGPPKKKQKQKKGKKGDADDFDYDEKYDEEFNEIYNGKTQKNRPGQRARRKQYEEMYGKDANHIQLRLKEKKSRGSSAKRSATAADSVPAKAPKQQEPVHPSWEAKRREKELMEQAKSVKGTKIVFD